MVPKPWLLPRAAVLQLLLLLLLLLQADPLHGEAAAARTAHSADLQALPSLTSFPFNLLDAVTRRPRQIRFKSSYLELPVGLRGLVGIRGLGHLSYFVQVDVPVTPPLSKALDRLPEGTKTYFPPYVSLLGATTPDEVTTEASQRPSVLSKTLGSSVGKGRITIIPIKNLSQVKDNELDTLFSTSTVSTLLETDGGLSATPSSSTYSTSPNPTTSVVQPHNVSYSPSGISWLPESFNFLRASPLGVSSSPPHKIKVTTTPTTYVTSTPIPNTSTTTSSTTTTSTSSSPHTVTTVAPLPSSSPSTSSLSSSFLSSYFFSIFSTTTPLPLTQHTSSSPQAATTSARLSSSTSSDSYLSKKHSISRTPSPSPTSPLTLDALTTPKTITPLPSSSTSSQVPARYPPPVKSNSAASSFPLIKKHSSALRSFALPSTPSISSQSFTFPSPPSYSSVKSRAPSSSRTSPPPPHSLTPSSATVPSKHVVKYAKFTPTSSPVKSVKVFPPPSASVTESSSFRALRPLPTTSFPSVNLPEPLFTATSGTNRIGHPSVCPPSSSALSVSTTARPVLPKHPRRPTTTSPGRRSKKPPVPSRSPRPLSSINNFFFQTSQPSTGLSSSPSSRLLAQMRALSTQSSSPSFKHTAASSSAIMPPTKPKPTAVGTNPKTFSSTPTQVIQLFPAWKQGRVTRVGENARKRVGGRLTEEKVGIGTVVRGGERGSGGKDRGKGGGEEGRKGGKAGRRTLGDIILERKLLLGRKKGGGKGSGSPGTVGRLGRLQIKNQPDRGNRVVADGQRGDFPAPRTTPPPDARTRHRDGCTHDDGDDDDDAAMAKRGSSGRPRLSSVVPRTAFSCPDGSEGGYFADRETGCQVFHVCWGKRRAAFLCPEGTLFNQLVQVCDWWYNVDCDATSVGGRKRQSPRDT